MCFKLCLVYFSEQCHNLISGIYKTSCKTGEGIEEMFADIAVKLGEASRSVFIMEYVNSV